MMKSRTLLTLGIIFLSLTTFCQNLTIEIKNNHPDEIRCKVMLDSLIDKYQLSNLLFTKHVILDYETNIPHSHPVLTLNTRYKKDEELLLSTFIHEQLHWYLNSKPSALLDTALLQLKQKFPNAPVGYPKGAADIESSYIHLIVNYLEIRILKGLIGELKASQILQYMMNDHYTWIYEQVNKNGFAIYKILNQNGLLLE